MAKTKTPPEAPKPHPLSKADQTKIAKATKALAEGDDELATRAARWSAKALKQAKGVRKTPMLEGEDGLDDAQRDALAQALGIDSEWLDANRRRLGYAR